ncbi:hypothetical protein [Geminicoccus roseus]|uniref:hypothetical protein n=1 Tax=Geminicoccus roseus TaxID=404900 RepID=UPI0012F7404C|nr:hypothetical protein [Geminicoccus roseus]
MGASSESGLVAEDRAGCVGMIRHDQWVPPDHDQEMAGAIVRLVDLFVLSGNFFAKAASDTDVARAQQDALS